MNAANVQRLLSLIPERSVRVSSGTPFLPDAVACQHPDRFARLLRFLNWLGPLEVLSKDEQRDLGLLSSPGRPALPTSEDDDSDLEPEAEVPPWAHAAASS
jgi:hypothetical protein